MEPITPSAATLQRLSPHLRRHVVAQDYAAYTPRDQAVWRHVVRRLARHLASRAHPAYLAGLTATGIGLDRIPSMDEMNERLAQLGWGAVAVRGFIPPAVFTELQAQRILAIACDIRSHEHLEYTPAPDIIHESAGHAPLIADPDYAAFLQRAGELGFRAIASLEDERVYEAVRALSVVKEDPAATAEEAAGAERRLQDALASRRYVSEATRASRLYWWTAEYGLVGPLEAPRIYGAGLLSSIGESTRCLGPEARRVPLDVRAADVDFDITRMQPQYFVVRELAALGGVVEDLARALSWRRGGDHGLREALRARTVNHLVLADGTEVTGVVDRLHPGIAPVCAGLYTAAVTLRGPTMITRAGKVLQPPADVPAVVAFGDARAPRDDASFCLAFRSGLLLSGRTREGIARELRGNIASTELDLPPHARLLSSPALPSVAGGPAHPGAWDARFGVPASDPEGELRARAHRQAALPAELGELYRAVRAAREAGAAPGAAAELAERARRWPGEALLQAELRELASGVEPAPVMATPA